MKESFRADIELLKSCAQPQASREQETKILNLCRAIQDWGRVLELANMHAVLPALYRNLPPDVEEHVPSTILRQMERSFKDILHRNLYLSGELHYLCDQLSGRGVRAIPYKGLVLAEDAYGTLAGRTFKDIDILIHPTELAKAMKILRENEFVNLTAGPGGNEGSVFQTLIQFAFYRSRDDCVVELHRGLGMPSEPLQIDFDSLWGSRGRTTVAGRSLPTVSATHRILILASHGTKHAWRRLGWISDLASVIQKYHDEIDWVAVLDLARESKRERAFLLGIEIATKVMSVSPPDFILEKARQDRWVATMRRAICARLCAGDSIHPYSISKLSIDIMAKDKPFSGTYRMVREQVFTPTTADYQWIPLPSQMHRLYHLLRPIRIGSKYIDRLRFER